MVDREEKRTGEQIARFFFKPFQYLCPTLLTTPIDILANSLIAKTIFSEEAPKKIEIVDNNEIFAAADYYSKSNFSS